MNSPRTKPDPRARIPSVSKLMALARRTAPAGWTLSHDLSARLARVLAAAMRADPDLTADETAMRAVAAPLWAPGPAPAINAAGVLLHTNMGRAPLRRETVQAALDRVAGYTDLEVDPDSGRRGSRHRHFAALARLVWDVEDALLVNNAAAAVCLSLAALGGGGETLVSRGELVEIGGSFRLPDIMALAGTRLAEVGTTNKTRIDDYRRRLGPDTACLLKTHPSNFRIEGFCEETSLTALVALGGERGIPVIMDLGSGLSRMLPFPAVPEPFIEDYLDMGPDLLIFSGDKLFGGVQAGVVLGKAAAMAKLRRHPFMRMVRLDKLSIAILCCQLRDIALGRSLPLAQLALAEPAELRRRAEAIRDACADALALEIVDEPAYIGGGSLPQEQRPAVALRCRPDHVAAFARKLRQRDPRLIGYIRDDALLLNLAAVFPNQDAELINAIKESR